MREGLLNKRMVGFDLMELFHIYIVLLISGKDRHLQFSQVEFVYIHLHQCEKYQGQHLLLSGQRYIYYLSNEQA